MKKIFKQLELNSGWKKVELKEFNDLYLIAVKKDKDGKKDTLSKDCVKKIRFEIAIAGGKKGKYLNHSQVVLNFTDIVSNDAEFDKTVASAKLLNYPSTFYIRPISLTGETSVANKGRTSIDVYVNEMRLR